MFDEAAHELYSFAMIRRAVTALLLFWITLPVCGYLRDMPLSDLILALQQQGNSIVYSNELVHPGQRVQVDSIDLQSLEHALTGLGLRLESREGVWLVVRGNDVPRAESVIEKPVSEELLPETIIVTGSFHHFPAVGVASSAHSFSSAAMSLAPSVASDAMRVTLRLPGISSVGVSAKPQIRGGLMDELLVMQDGVELLEPFHLADYHSVYSSIDYRNIESLDFYTGGFPSRYGNRMSGVMDIQNKWQDDEYDTDIGVSTFANFIHTGGQFGQERPGNWLVSARQGDLKKLADYIETQSGEPTYVDASARMSVALSDNSDLAFGAAYAEDDIEFKGETELASSNVETGYVWSGWQAELGPDLRTHFTLSWLDLQRTKTLDSFEEEPKGGFLDYQQQVQRLALRNDWSALHGETLLEFGWQGEYNLGDYQQSSRIDRGDLADILETQRLVERDIDLQPDGFSGGTYLQAQWQLAPRLTVQPSLRWDFQDYYLESDARYQVSPRLGLAYDISDTARARISLGRFSQPEGVQELQVLDGITRFYEPQNSDQVVTGLEWRDDTVNIVAEVYYKRYSNQKGRFENIFNPFVLLPEMEPDRVALNPQRAEASGLDLDMVWHIAAPLSGNVRYGYMNAQDRIEGEWVDRRWSQRHTVNTGLLWQQEDYSFSVAATWHSGWRSTQLPAVVEEGTVIPVASVLNNTELRDYFSLDISARKYWEIGKTRLQVYADVSNLTRRHNQAGIDYDVEEIPGGFALIPDQETLLGRVISVGVTLSF